MRPAIRNAVLACLAFACAPPAIRAWIYSEHRAITARGIETLDPRRRAQLDEIWSEARADRSARLCEALDAGAQGAKPSCIDLSAWPAIAGDHSCTPPELLATILDSDWILPVAAIAERAGEKIAHARTESERRNVQMKGDLGLERTDKEYSTRAGASNAHFLLPRGAADPRAYAAEALRGGVEPNAMALYVLFHVAAMHQAAALAGTTPSPVEVREVLALESFALHFLEDSFAAGHIAGSWGKAAERKGTHDYYNEHGLDTETWKHESIVLFGDGHMHREDLERAGAAVRQSVSQVLDAGIPGTEAHQAALAGAAPKEVTSGAFNLCRVEHMPDWHIPPPMDAFLSEVLLDSPIPFRGPGFASLPRFRAEIGSFLGLASGFSFASADGGFVEGNSGGVQGGLDVGLRLGLGLDALLGDGGDGLLYLQGGIFMQSRSSGNCEPYCSSDPLVQQFVPGIPARTGLSLRLRMPYWLIPGDLILATPLLAFTDPKLLEKMAITAADGGLIPWQTKLATPFGRVQFVLGREVAVHLFGRVAGKDAFLAINPDGPNGQPVLTPIAVRSIQWDFPVVEVRPFREYGTRYAFAGFFQIGAGFDHPTDAETLIPGQALPKLKTRYFGYLRIYFDGRRYF
ncbi:MAG TPA: hypothetical protein VMQ61_06085 [Thermoanaerobaculia bacterium]|nr:hypothetical protein [Thermoanaerobaculia bacterium]